MSYLPYSDITLKEYLLSLKKMENLMVIISVKDTFGAFLEKEDIDIFKELGLYRLSVLEKAGKLERRKGFVAVLADSDVIFQELSEKNASVHFHKKIGRYEVDAFSSPYSGLNISSILIDDEEYSVNERGINIVVLNTKTDTVIDSVAFDTGVKEKKAVRLFRYIEPRVLPREKNALFLRDIEKVKDRLKLTNLLPNYEWVSSSKDLNSVFNNKIKVRFFFYGAYNLWNAMESVAKAFSMDDRYDVLVVMTNRDILYKTVICIGKGGFTVIHDDDYDIEKDRPDIAIYNWHSYYRNCSSVKLKVLVAAGLVTGTLATFDIRSFCRKIVNDKNDIDYIITEKFIQKMVVDHDPKKNGKWVGFGNPKFDLIYENVINHPPLPEGWKKIEGKKVILWAFDHGWYTKNATFDLFAKEFFEYFSEKKDMALIIRPHRSYPAELLSKGVWSANDLAVIKNYCETTLNIIWDDTFDYGLSYAVADAIITDVNCGITISALPLKKPLAVLLRFDEGSPEPEQPEVIDALYKINSYSELSVFLNMISEDKDPMYKRRMSVKERFISDFDGKNGQRIKDFIVGAYEEKTISKEQ